MKCLVCNNKEVDIMWGCGIQNIGLENEKVVRTWGCIKCNSGGEIEYIVDRISIIKNKGEKIK